jgi:hypothetical protein
MGHQIVKDYTIQGWTMDVERLKRGGNLMDEFFERQLEKIREIRLSAQRKGVKLYLYQRPLLSRLKGRELSCICTNVPSSPASPPLASQRKGVKLYLYQRPLLSSKEGS